MGYILMAKYFEVINDDSSICIDDAYKNLELLDIVEMKTATKKLISTTPQGSNYQYTYIANDDATRNGVIRGIGLKELSGKSFCVKIYGGYFYFYDPAAGSKCWVARDDVVDLGKIYIFGYRDREPASTLAGLEVYNSEGKTVYSSAAKYLDIVACGNDTTTTIELDDSEICALELGADCFCHIYENHRIGAKGIDSETHPYFIIADDCVTIKRQTFNDIYVDEIEEDQVEQETFSAYYTYGWMLGKVLH